MEIMFDRLQISNRLCLIDKKAPKAITQVKSLEDWKERLAYYDDVIKSLKTENKPLEEKVWDLRRAQGQLDENRQVIKDIEEKKHHAERQIKEREMKIESKNKVEDLFNKDNRFRHMNPKEIRNEYDKYCKLKIKEAYEEYEKCEKIQAPPRTLQDIMEPSKALKIYQEVKRAWEVVIGHREDFMMYEFIVILGDYGLELWASYSYERSTYFISLGSDNFFYVWRLVEKKRSHPKYKEMISNINHLISQGDDSA